MCICGCLRVFLHKHAYIYSCMNVWMNCISLKIYAWWLHHYDISCLYFHFKKMEQKNRVCKQVEKQKMYVEKEYVCWKVYPEKVMFRIIFHSRRNKLFAVVHASKIKDKLRHMTLYCCFISLFYWFLHLEFFLTCSSCVLYEGIKKQTFFNVIFLTRCSKSSKENERVCSC